MPQAARGTVGRPSGSSAEKDQAAKAQEQEFKRARGAISCAECRRLKLKCDKTVPCSSCKRRGCASICPNGSLTTGQGTRHAFILADTDRLHKKISEMSDRIRQLEDALAIMQSSTTRETHPLLRADLLIIKSGLELHSASHFGSEDPQDGASLDSAEKAIDHFGTLAVRDDGAARYLGWSAGTENEKPTQDSLLDEAETLPTEISELARTFPASALQLDTGETLQSQIESYLPEWPRAQALAALYLEQAPWFFGAIKRRQVIEELLPMFYPDAQANIPDSDTPPSQPGAHLASSTSAFALAASKSVNSTGGAHDLALLFVVFCFGALTDPALPPAPYNKEASTYYELTRAALNIEPVLDRAPSVATVQTLSLMGIYQGLVAGENSIESTWALMGLACKLAQSVNRDCARWKLPPAEVQKRRALFWELFITDCWQGLATGRIPSFSLPFIDCELPADPDETIADDGTRVPSFPAWKATWGKECVSNVVEVTLQAKAPKYSLILQLDRKIRDVELPKYAQGESPRNATLSETMKHFMAINYRELTLLYIHRTFFAQALKDHPLDPLKSQYAPSFLAGYRAACAMISTVREQFNINPVQIARFWVLWTHAFSSVVMLGSVVTHGGITKTAQAALGEVRLAYDLFEKAARYGGRAVKFLPIVRRIHDKAYRAFSQGYQMRRKDIFTPREQQDEEDGNDELSIFSGRTRTVATKAASKTPNRPRSQSRRRVESQQGGDSSSSPSTSDPSRSSMSPPSQGSPETPATSAAGPSPQILETYGNAVHPMLVDQIRSFESELDTQIYNAQQAFYINDAIPTEANPSAAGFYSAAPVEPQYSAMYVQQEYQQPHDPEWSYQVSEQMPPPPVPAHVQLALGQEQLPHTFQSQTYQSPPHPMPPSHHEAPHPPPPEQAYSVPMYGAVEPAAHHHGYIAQVYDQPPVPPPAAAPVQVMSHMPHPVDPRYVTQDQQAQQWQQQQYQPQQQAQEQQYSYPVQQQQQHQQQYQVYYEHPQSQVQPTPTHSRPQSMHGSANYGQPAPSLRRVPTMESLHTGQHGYNLQDSWNTFFQHELPAPPGGPLGAGRR
ncbi:hypothetical protein BDY19DRAFT_891492 [Irpex rosettiformis]|uniref:Uncharacterized protein n=1 Tax=Irpex rosettiformis TaxID=378272 RepID=A0ACB8U1X7_9APHY|nr:hypothetical protein BDY19DRAFT_891492 [Irpex rosettiformis]